MIAGDPLTGTVGVVRPKASSTASGSPIMMGEFVDSETRSGSSDDTLTLHSTNGVSHDSGKGSSASVDVFIHRATNPVLSTGGSGKVGGASRPSILDSSDSDDVLDED